MALFVIFENFIKYSPDRKPISVTIDESADEVILSFRGYGPVATPSEAGRVFEWEFRAEMAKRMTNNGSGIGLHFAKEVCDLHGFRISFSQESEDKHSQSGIDYFKTTVAIEIFKNV